jgi:phospholipid N-methyltransferase
MGHVNFIQEFLKHPRQLGTFIQSSKYLARKIAREIDGSTRVVEFGPGTGPVTKEILRHLPENGHLTCFEVNSRFCEHLEKIGDPRLRVINDNARNCHQYTQDLDCIVSGLPLALFGKLEKEQMLHISSKSKKYIQLQYTPFLRKKMKNYFPDVKVKFIPFNVPPAFLYVCNGHKN